MPKIEVPGASIHFQTVGSGPLLVISQSGEGDADRTADLVPRLVNHFTVLTYDRRGLSRSRPHDPDRGASIADHADDLDRLLAHVTDGPVVMLGCSLGAVIGLHLAVARPGRLRTLVAHEPIAPWLLPHDEAQQHRRELVEIQDAYRAGGLAGALPAIVRSLDIDPSGAQSEPGLTAFPMDAGRAANFDHFIRHDFTAAIEDRLDPGLLVGLGTRVVPAAGEATSGGVFDRRCAEALAAVVSSPVRLFPGGHNGNLSHPRAYARRLLEVLGEPAAATEAATARRPA
ncbi:alpha/beta fold hydrolase [Isoptericola sp. NPDC057191]|uniref:alpha/beta fold hydrolase n=1 Tax=Isoptericola sp. NPDC057191 TaxID=3346041 RepID=UPI00362F1C1F